MMTPTVSVQYHTFIVSTGQNKLSTDINKQKMALCQYIVANCELHEIDWNKIADTLRSISMEHLAVKIRENYCQQGNASGPVLIHCHHCQLVQIVPLLLPSISQQRKSSNKMYHYVSPLAYIAEEV